MAFLNLEKVGRDFTLSGKEFHNFIVEGKKDLECLQLEAARIVTGLPIYSSAESLYFETGWSKLEDRRKSRKLNLIAPFTVTRKANS
jgi:hypothetical protein